jgi:ABC-type cobalamin/Fe3+-siderophores transport system ATPase subunit
VDDWSGVQRHRERMAVVFAQRADISLLDEPTLCRDVA